MTTPADSLTFEEAAADLGYTPRQLYRWREEGELSVVEEVVTLERKQAVARITRDEVERLRQVKGQGRRKPRTEPRTDVEM